MIENISSHNQIIDLLQKSERDSASWNDTIPKDNSSHILAFLNAHAITTAIKNPVFYKTLMDSSYLLRDGIGIKMAMTLFRMNPSKNLNGSDLITHILPALILKKIAIYGASDVTLATTSQKLKENGIHNIIDMQHGFHDFEFYLNAYKAKQPDVIILCMGMPKQEILASQLYKQSENLLIICGGGWADFYSGTKSRAPLWVRKLSLEWVHRLLREPKRLGKRYTIDIVYFFYVIIQARLKYRKI